MTLDEVTEVIQYLNQHPTAAEILALVYEVKTNAPWKPISEDQFNKELSEVPPGILGPVEKAPEDFLDSVSFAKDMLAKMKKSAPN